MQKQLFNEQLFFYCSLGTFMFNTYNSVLLVIDIQGKLAHLMHDKEELFKHCRALIQMALILEIPIICTEQAPEKIGFTVDEIKSLIPDISPIRKQTFSCFKESEFEMFLSKQNRKQIITCGIETHVCVSQTVEDLINADYSVKVIGDAVSSRTESNKNFALNYMEKLGAQISTTEMIATELLVSADHPDFKEVLKLIR